MSESDEYERRFGKGDRLVLVVVVLLIEIGILLATVFLQLT